MTGSPTGRTLHAMAQAFRYVVLANDLERQIRGGVYGPGERLPSIRQLHRNRGLAITTVSQALAELERRGLVEARPRSGYFVRVPRRIDPPAVERTRSRPRRVPLPHLADDFVTASADPSLVPLGGTVLSHEVLPIKHLARLTKDAVHRNPRVLASYGPPTGDVRLRGQIARRLLDLGLPVTKDEIVVSSGCMDAIRLALAAIAKPGDTVAVESPTFFGFLQLVRALDLLAIEIPTDPERGMDVEALRKAVEGHRVRALLLTPAFHNPTGACLEPAAKEEIAAICRKHKVTIIEDDVYGDLHHGKVRPRPIAAKPMGADVMYCSSFSKTLSPGLRVGYVVPGKHFEKVARLKLASTIASPVLNQRVISDFLETGAYERHLRQLRTALTRQVHDVLEAVRTHFPRDVRATTPHGGFVVWVHVGDVDTLEVYDKARAQRISFLPGPLCSCDPRRYRGALRLSCGHPMSERLDEGLRRLGDLLRGK